MTLNVMHGKMLIQKVNIILLIAISLLAFSCKKEPIEVMGLEAVYFDALDFSEIRTQPAQDIDEQGKILKKGDYLFINEKKKGIHVVDNQDPTNPFYVFFWNIPGNLNFTINGDFLYADNGPHMVIINISDYADIKYDSHIVDAFYENIIEQYPDDEEFGFYFKCTDPEKGLVKEWVPVLLTNPNCRKI